MSNAHREEASRPQWGQGRGGHEDTHHVSRVVQVDVQLPSTKNITADNPRQYDGCFPRGTIGYGVSATTSSTYMLYCGVLAQEACDLLR